MVRKAGGIVGIGYHGDHNGSGHGFLILWYKIRGAALRPGRDIVNMADGGGCKNVFAIQFKKPLHFTPENNVFQTGKAVACGNPNLRFNSFFSQQLFHHCCKKVARHFTIT